MSASSDFKKASSTSSSRLMILLLYWFLFHFSISRAETLVCTSPSPGHPSSFLDHILSRTSQSFPWRIFSSVSKEWNLRFTLVPSYLDANLTCTPFYIGPHWKFNLNHLRISTLIVSLSQKTLGSAEVPTEFGGEGTLKNRDHQEVPPKPKGLRMMKFDKKWFVEYL